MASPRAPVLALVFVLLLLLLAASPATAQDTVTLLTVETYPTISSMSVLATYAGDDDQDSLFWVESRPAGSGAYARGHDLLRLSGRRLAGSLFFLDPATAYDVRVVAVDVDDNSRVLLLDAPVTTTRADVPAVATGPDWWVDAAAGSDTNPGTAVLPFRTIGHGASVAGPGHVVHVRPGVYRERVVPPRGGSPVAPLVFRAEGAGVAIDGSDAAIASGASWRDEGGNRWSTPFPASSAYVAVDDARVYDYQTLADLVAENGNVGAPGVFPGGFFVDAAGGRLHLITPGHDDPAAHQVHVAVEESTFLLDQLSDVVIEGFEMRYQGATGNGGVGVDVRDTARSWVRDNVMHHMNTAVRVRRPLASENVIEGNTFRDTSVYSWPWASVKGHTPEASAVEVTGGHGNVVRCNDLEGSFNGIYTGTFGNADEDIARDTDIHGNLLRSNGDDGLELEGAQRNVRAWGNTIVGPFNAISLAPVEVGPAFLVRNVIAGYTQHAFKVNNGPTGWMLVYHTTAAPASGLLFPDAQAMEPTLPFAGLVTRNNILEANRYVIEYGDTSLAGPVEMDHDDLYTHDVEGQGRFVKWLNVRYTNVQDLGGSGSIERNGVEVLPAYQDPALLDYTLAAGSPLVDLGVPVPGINDAYAGFAPDMGAFDRGGPALGCSPGIAPPASALLRNTRYPALTRAAIFRGPWPGCGSSLDPGCPAFPAPSISLDPFGPDCRRGAPPLDDDTYVPGFACDALDPDPTLLGDNSRPLVFYQIDRTPGVCNGLLLVKELGAGSLRILCP